MSKDCCYARGQERKENDWMHGDGANTAQTEPSFLLHLPSLSLSHRCTHEKCCGKESAKFQQGVWCVWWKWSELIERLVTQKLSPNSQLQLYITREQGDGMIRL